MNINLKKINFNSETEIKILKRLMNDKNIMREFCDFRYFFMSIVNDIIYFIKLKDKIIGFIALTKVGYEENYFFIDSGITCKYTGLGYGKEALRIFIDNYEYTNPLLIRTRKENVLGNGSIKSFTTYLTEINNYNFYIVNKFLKKDDIEDINREKQYVLSNKNFIYTRARDFIKDII